jgi:hypothetical protein
MLDALAQLCPDVDTRPFWEFCRRRELRFQRCVACRRFRHPPLPGCPHCGDTAIEWTRVAGRGRIFSYTIAHHAAVPPLATEVPYNVVVVEFDDAPGARLVTNVIDVTPASIRVGGAVEVVWDEPSPGVVLPRVRLTG